MSLLKAVRDKFFSARILLIFFVRILLSDLFLISFIAVWIASLEYLSAIIQPVNSSFETSRIGRSLSKMKKIAEALNVEPYELLKFN